MKLTPLFDAEYVYTDGPEMLPASEGDSGRQLVGAGKGEVRGQRINGTFEWKNAPFLIEGVFTPNIRGLIETLDGGRIRFETHGMSYPPIEGEPNVRRLVMTVRLRSTSAAYKWVNGLMGVEEGVIHIPSRMIRTRVFSLEAEFDGGFPR